MANTTKPLSERDSGQVLQAAAVTEDDSIVTSGFLVGKVGRKIDVSITTTNVANDTAVYAFSEAGSALYTLTMVYTDGTRAELLSAERTA